jgi:hypothetical protein
MAEGTAWFCKFKTPLGDVVASAQVVELVGDRFLVTVRTGEVAGPPDFASSLEGALRQAEHMVRRLRPDARPQGWVQGQRTRTSPTTLPQRTSPPIE